MKERETVPVWRLTIRGRTVCVCHAARRKCGDPRCERDTLERDRFRGWPGVMRRDRFGK